MFSLRRVLFVQEVATATLQPHRPRPRPQCAHNARHCFQLHRHFNSSATRWAFQYGYCCTTSPGAALQTSTCAPCTRRYRSPVRSGADAARNQLSHCLLAATSAPSPWLGRPRHRKCGCAIYRVWAGRSRGSCRCAHTGLVAVTSPRRFVAEWSACSVCIRSCIRICISNSNGNNNDNRNRHRKHERDVSAQGSASHFVRHEHSGAVCTLSSRCGHRNRPAGGAVSGNGLR